MISVIVLAGAILSTSATDDAKVQALMYQPHDFEFRSSTHYDNPFQVRLDASVTGPGGVTYTIPGFYDGDGVWKVRFSPTAPGEWMLQTDSDDENLDGIVVDNIECVPNPNERVHGALRVDPAHPHHFIFEDGSRFFLMGYECDWLWALDTTNPELPVINAFLDKLCLHGFNYIIMNVYAHDTHWKTGHTETRDYGPPPVYPWEGSNDAPQQDRLDLDFWQHYDRVIDALYQRGMIAHIMTKVYNKMVNWPAPNSPEEDLYYRTLVARYSAYPNVVWDFSKEAHGEGNLEYKIGRIRRLRELDPYKRLLTVHDDSATYDAGHYNDLLDYRSDQQHSDWHKTILAQRSQKEWPVVNVEFGYEWGPKGEGDATYPVIQSPEEVLRRAWEVYTAGGYGAYYYTYTAWDIIHPEHNPPGYAYFANLRRFFEQTDYWLLEPHDELVDRGRCLAQPGVEYVVFHTEGGQFTLTVEGAQQPLECEWHSCTQGTVISVGKIGNGTHILTIPPSLPLPGALHVRVR